jgi:hypothetical protein
MTTIINGSSPSITFSDSTTQTTAFTGSASTLTSGTLPFSVMPTGSVLQVVQAALSSTITTSSTSYVATGLIASITPKFSTSKILATVNGGITTYGTAEILLSRIYRQIASGSYAGIGGVEAISLAGSAYLYPHSLSWLDSPATTSTVNYQPYFASSGGNLVYYNYYGGAILGQVTLTLMEIAG